MTTNTNNEVITFIKSDLKILEGWITRLEDSDVGIPDMYKTTVKFFEDNAKKFMKYKDDEYTIRVKFILYEIERKLLGDLLFKHMYEPEYKLLLEPEVLNEVQNLELYDEESIKKPILGSQQDWLAKVPLYHSNRDMYSEYSNFVKIKEKYRLVIKYTWGLAGKIDEDYYENLTIIKRAELLGYINFKLKHVNPESLPSTFEILSRIKSKIRQECLSIFPSLSIQENGAHTLRIVTEIICNEEFRNLRTTDKQFKNLRKMEFFSRILYSDQLKEYEKIKDIVHKIIINYKNYSIKAYNNRTKNNNKNDEFLRNISNFVICYAYEKFENCSVSEKDFKEIVFEFFKTCIRETSIKHRLKYKTCYSIDTIKNKIDQLVLESENKHNAAISKFAEILNHIVESNPNFSSINVNFVLNGENLIGKSDEISLPFEILI